MLLSLSAWVTVYQTMCCNLPVLEWACVQHFSCCSSHEYGLVFFSFIFLFCLCVRVACVQYCMHGFIFFPQHADARRWCLLVYLSCPLSMGIKQTVGGGLAVRLALLDCSKGRAGLSSAAPHVAINVNTINMFVVRPAQLKGESETTEPWGRSLPSFSSSFCKPSYLNVLVLLTALECTLCLWLTRGLWLKLLLASYLKWVRVLSDFARTCQRAVGLCADNRQPSFLTSYLLKMHFKLLYC